MTPSIRTFLLINLLLSVTLIISLAIVGNLLLAHQDIQAQLDAQLVRSTERIRDFFSDYKLETHNLGVIQHNLLTPNMISPQNTAHPSSNPPTTASNNSMEFQIWNQQGRLILHSANTPTTPLSAGQSGLSTLPLQGEAWRVSTLKDAETGLTFMTAERSNYRQDLENRLTRDSIIIMIITYPLLGLLIWVIVGRGLKTLKRVATEVAHRAPSYLEPVGVEAIPPEIAPLVNELNHLFGRLKEAFEREKRFTADAAHELRTPLAALNTYTQVALRAQTPDERKQALLKVLTGVNRGAHVVQQLLTLSRMTPEATINEPMRVDIAKEAAEIAAQLAPEAIAKNIDLELITPPDHSPYVLGNSTAIGILIRNLVDNSIRYSPENSTVTIQLQETKEHVILRVIDNGPGIPQELQERVFERFFRVIGNQTTGSGLGLSIVQQIAKLHHAKIILKTPENGQGLDFQVIFPAVS